jgi:hypothetical protein
MRLVAVALWPDYELPKTWRRLVKKAATGAITPA